MITGWSAVMLLSLAAGAEVVLVSDGQPAGAIVIPAAATSTEAYAGAELARYLEAVSGAALPVVNEGLPLDGVLVHVGPTTVARAALPAEIAAAPEGLYVRVAPTGIVLCGGSDRGTLYAVYRFLEQAVGCRWLAADQEYLPERPTIALAPLELATVPAFDLRTFVARREDRRAWGVKVGMNGFYTDADVEPSGGGYYLPKQVPSCHAYSLLMPADTYYEEHPEWYPLIRGQRVPTKMHNAQLCVTAPGLADEFAKNVIKLFDEDPNLKIVSISPNDGRGWCECEACRALDQKLSGGRTTKQGLAGERPFVGDRVFWFANEVAERVAKVHPDKLLLVLAYINYAEPPDTIEPASNVVPWLCHYAPADYSRPINDPTSEPNSQFDDILRRWAKRSPHLLFYAYVSKSMWWRLPRPVTHNFAADVKHLYSLGIHRYYCQSGLSDWRLDGPLYYVIAKLLWDPSADPDVLAADWIEHMYGAAAGPMTEFYQAVEEAVRETGRSYSDNPPRDVPGLYNMPDLERALKHLEAAAAAADSDIARERIDGVTRVFRYGYHMIRSLEASHRFRLEPTRAAMLEAAEEGSKALEYAATREAKKFVSELRLSDEMGVIARGFGEALELGGRRCWNSDETGPGDGKAGWATLAIETPDTTKPVRLEIDCWGTSALGSIVVNTGGQGKGYSAGGVWTPVRPEQALSGEEKWDTLVFIVPPEVMTPGKAVQTVGFGGGDSQVWIAAVRVKPVEE